MNCNQVECLIPGYREGTLSDGKRRALERHLAHCSGCTRLLEAWDRAAARLRDLPEPPLPKGYLDRLRRKMDTTAPVQTGWRVPRWVFVPALGVLLCVVGAGLWVTRRWGSSEPATPVAPVHADAKLQSVPVPQERRRARNEAPVRSAQRLPSAQRPSTSDRQRDATQPAWTTATREVALAKYGADEPRPMVLRGAGERIQRTRIVKQWQDEVSGIRERTVVLARSRPEWERLWRQHTAGMQPPPEVPEVNFNREMVVAVFMGEQPTRGYGVQVAAVEETADTVYVQVEERFPAAGAKHPAMPVSPYHIVVVATR